MSIGSKIADFVGKSIFKEAKELITQYWPPDVSPEKRAEFEIQMRELEIKKTSEAMNFELETLKTELSDTQNARAAHQHSIMPSVITVMLTAMACGLLWAIFFVEIPDSSQNLAYSLFGSVFTLWGASVQFWIGTTRSSSEKNKLLAESTPPKQ